MKLHEAPQGCKIYCECSDGSSWVRFHRIDGMYSLCVTEYGVVTHLYVCAQLVPVDGEANAFRLGTPKA